jgi:hypothetical protein
MSGILKVDQIRNNDQSVRIFTEQLTRRLIQRTTRWFRGGLWNPGNNYYEIPGSFINITPLYDNSFIRYTYMCPLGHRGAAHSITHWIFMANGQEYARHSRSMDHQEEGAIHQWEVPSWGKGKSGSLGYLTRQYADSNHSVHFNGRRYTAGADSSRGEAAWVSVEEYVPASGMVLHLDAASEASYPGTGTKWFDLSGNDNHFDIVAGAYNSSGPKYMDFNGSFGIAKQVDFDTIHSGDTTIICWTRIKNSSADWRTLIRGLSTGGDHQVMVQSGAWAIGMYDNVNGSGFNSSGFSQQSLPNYASNGWNMLVFRFNNSAAPYYTISYNDSTEVIRGSIASVNARFEHGFSQIGGYGNGVQTNPANAAQYWGDIANIQVYSRIVNDYEIKQIFNATRSRFGI